MNNKILKIHHHKKQNLCLRGVYMAKILITCLPCEREAKYAATINNQNPINLTFKGEDQDLFNENIYNCPFCGMTLSKTNILEAFLNYFSKNDYSVQIKENVIEINKNETNLLFKSDVFLNNDVSTIVDISFPLTKNEIELIRLFFFEFDQEQWTISIEAENKRIA